MGNSDHQDWTATIWKTLSPFWGEEYNVHLPPTFHTLSFHVLDEDSLRTATIWKTLSPFWGEEYNVHLPPTFHTLSFHVLDEDSLSRDDVIGKVSITKEVLATKPQGFDGWMSLTEVDPDEEVQGEIHLQISIQTRRLCCHVFEARGNLGSLRLQLRLRDERVLPSSHYRPLTELLCQAVSSNLNGNQPDLLMLIDETTTAESRQEVATNLVKLFLGHGLAKEFLDVLFKLELEKTSCRNAVSAQSSALSLISLPSSLIQVAGMQYLHRVLGPTVNRVFDEKKYVELDPSKVEIKEAGLGIALVWGLFSWYSPVPSLSLSSPTMPNTDGEGYFIFDLECPIIFSPHRSNSSHSSGELKVAGMQYLHRVLGPTVNRVFDEKKYVELDPSKVEIKEAGCTGLHRIQTEAEVIQQSTQHLQSYLTELLHSIVKSVSHCPPLLRMAFRQLCERVQERFPEREYRKVKFIAVTSFLCLRFFSPAIMSPKLFHLREKHPDARTSRTLLLLAKAVQSIGNLDTLAVRSKEPWMGPLQPAIQQGIAQLKEFISQLISFEDKEGEPHTGDTGNRDFTFTY
ncbi:UNVERIFIED_CONTAM: hypothetical protein FKN15_009153 [Acipenser sinensis]